MQDESQVSHFNHCSEQPVVKNLTIEGSEWLDISVSCNKFLKEYNQLPFIFHFENSTVVMTVVLCLC